MKKVKDIMIRDLTAISENATLKEATKILAQHRFSGVPVVDDKYTLIGFISEKDIIDSAFPGQFGRSDDFFIRNFALLARQISEVGEKYVRDYMTTDVFAVREDETLTDLAEIMIRENLKTVPVLREGRLIGIVLRTTLCRNLMEEAD